MDRPVPDKLKKTLSSPPNLDYPRRCDTFTLITDASEHGLGAIALHLTVECASCSLTDVEKKYCTSEQECSAIAWATRKLRHYLIRAQFTLEMDHRVSQKEPCTLKRWALELQAFEFDAVHHPGKLNHHVDALSRFPVMVVGTNPSIAMSALSAKQIRDPMFSVVHKQLEANQSPPAKGIWNKFPGTLQTTVVTTLVA